MVQKERPIIGANWKMNGTVKQGEQAVETLLDLAATLPVVMFACVPFTLIYPLAQLIQRHTLHGPGEIAIGAQNVAWAESGPYTGEISASMLRDAGASYVMVGHAERRRYFDETDHEVSAKVRVVLKEGLMPVVCVGEPERITRKGEIATESGVDALVRTVVDSFAGLSRTEVSHCIIAYEPWWAIGSDVTPSGEDVEQAHKVIRNVLSAEWDQEVANRVKVIYGGSVNPLNAATFMGLTGVDGVYVGRSSLEARSFEEIVRTVQGEWEEGYSGRQVT